MLLQNVQAPEIFGDNAVAGGELLIGEERTIRGRIESAAGVAEDITSWTLGVAAVGFTADGTSVTGLSNFSRMAVQPASLVNVTFTSPTPASGETSLFLPRSVFDDLGAMKPPANAVRELPVLALFLSTARTGRVDINRIVVMYRRGD